MTMAVSFDVIVTAVWPVDMGWRSGRWRDWGLRMSVVMMAVVAVRAMHMRRRAGAVSTATTC